MGGTAFLIMSRVSGKPYFVYALWSPSGRRFYIGISDNPSARQERTVFRGHKAFWGVQVEFSPNGRWLAMTTNVPGTDPLELRSAVFEAATRQSITAVAGHPFKFAPDGTLATKVSDSALAV